MNTVPTGFHGVLSSSARVDGVTAASSASAESSKRPSTIGARTGRDRAAGERDRRVVGVVDRVGQQDLVAVADQRRQRAGQAERGPGRGENFRAGVVGHAVVARELRRHRLAEAQLAAVVRIAGAAGPHRLDDRVGDVSRRPEVGLAAHQRDDGCAGAWTRRTSARMALTAVGLSSATRGAAV